MLSLQEENQLLQQELSCVEDLLAQSRAERDELAIKYNAVNERVGAAPGLRAGLPCFEDGETARPGPCTVGGSGVRLAWVQNYGSANFNLNSLEQITPLSNSVFCGWMVI